MRNGAVYPWFAAGTALSAAAPRAPRHRSRSYDAPDAWTVISSRYAIEASRLKLAEAILAVARDDSRDAEQTESVALQLMRIAR